MPKEHNGDLAAAISDKAATQLRELLINNWTDIERIKKDNEGEIVITAKVQINDRKATPGEHAECDNRLKTTVSFSEKYSDSLEGELPNPEQPELAV